MKPLSFEKPVVLDIHTLEPVAKPKKTWGSIPQVKPQPLNLHSKSTTPVKSKGTTGPAGPTGPTAPIESRGCERGLEVDKSDEAKLLLQQMDETVHAARKNTAQTSKPVLDFASLPTLGSAMKAKGKK